MEEKDEGEQKETEPDGSRSNSIESELQVRG